MHPTLQYILDRFLAGEHSIFSPSSSPMWIGCSGSLVPNVLSENRGTDAAAKGTVAHTIAEEWLKTNQRPSHYLGTLQIVEDDYEFFVVKVDDEMMDRVEAAVERSALVEGQRQVELKVDFSELTPIPQQRGTLDCVTERGSLAVLDDHKFGGLRVDALQNPQLMLYAFGYIKDRPHIKDLVLRINQPYLDHFDEFETTRDEIMQFAGYAKARAALAWAVDAPRTPSKKACQWCRISATCPAYAAAQFQINTELTAQAFTVEQMQDFKAALPAEKPATIDPLALTTEELCIVKAYQPSANKFWKVLDGELAKRIKAGDRAVKFVAGRSRREFTDDAIETLKDHGLTEDQLFVRTMISPSKAEPMLVKLGHKRRDLPTLLGDIVKRRPGKPVIALASDPRPSISDIEGVTWGDTSETAEDEDI